MSMNTLKSIARRSSLLGSAFAILVATVIPAASVFADSLNPLTKRSLLLTSSAPGFQKSDGSGNTGANPNAVDEYYAPPGSGANGWKTGETFTFNVSTDSVVDTRPIKAFTLQYCTTAAGWCQAPGNNSGDRETDDRGDDTDTTSDLNVNYGPSAVPGTDYIVMMGTQNVSTDWVISTSNVEDSEHSGALTGKNNFITLTHATGISPVFDQQIQLIFKASDTNYITNPGDDEFFVKINSYDTDNASLHIPTVGAVNNPNIIDGGVTVANVMTDSIHITTKVLETMSFSVGTQNRDTVNLTGQDVHGTCDNILQPDGNRLNLGNPDAEYSLETGTAWDVNSYWRLSSNSSGGATVYYSGNTLANTVGDEIAEIGPTAATSTPGTEQFGLAFVDAAEDTFATALSDPTTGLYVTNPERYKIPSLTRDLLAPNAVYANGTGIINPDESDDPEDPVAEFAFVKSSNTIPAVIASNNDNVISCATAKMRYIANIGADTPAGVYTTKINYLAAPQY